MENYFYISAVIDSRGNFYIFSKNQAKLPRRIHLQEPVYDICRCSMYVQSNAKNENQHKNLQKNKLKFFAFATNLTIKKKEIMTINAKLKFSFTSVLTVN